MKTEGMEILAPGKLVLMGEYAIRHRAPGLVMAVDRLARLRWLTYTRDMQDDLVSQARFYAAKLLGLGRPSRCSVDSSGFYHDGQKLGLGSSAAVTAVAVASVFLEAELDISDEAQRQKIWAVSKEVHDGFQGMHGSGIDLAASIFGGYLVMNNGLDNVSPWRFWEIPDGLELVFCWTGSQSSTVSLVDAVDRWSMTHEDEHREIMSDMTDVANRFCNSHLDAVQSLEEIDRYGRLMDRLGQACGIGIVTPMMRDIRLAAMDLGGAAKPSGAGGGDFMVAGFSDFRSCNEFKNVAVRIGAKLMNFKVCKEGLASRSANHDRIRQER